MKLHIFQNKVVYVVLALSILTIISGCKDDFVDVPGQFLMRGDSITLSGSIIIPDMHKTMSRSLADNPSGNLKLTIFEFDKKETAATSYLTEIYKAEISSSTDANSVNFKVTLKSSEAPKVLHFMLAEDYLTSSFGSIASILPKLTVDNGKEAYWGSKEFPYGYVKIEDNKLLDNTDNDVSDKLNQIPLIRNFSKISVTAVTELGEKLSNFKLLGFNVVNVPTVGTIAPWDNQKLEVPELLGNDDKMKDYSEITYRGCVAEGAYFENKESDAKKWIEKDLIRINDDQTGNTSLEMFLYEHPFESTRRSYLIIYGEYTYTPLDGEPTTTRGYYKIDIGKTVEEDGFKSFKYYNIIRNIHYKVNISAVDAPGYQTVEDAVEHAPSNNLSASVETESMLNISDGTNSLIVDAINHIIIDDNKPIEIFYRYIQNIDTPNPSSPTTSDEYNNLLKVIVGEGDVIKKPVEITSTLEDEDKKGIKWMKITLNHEKPTDITKTQTITIVDKKGMGRTINLILREPWQYSPIYKKNGKNYFATVANGAKNSYSESDPQPEDISSESGAELTVYFNLPDGLPEAMFPLQFQLESRSQWIENNKTGNLVVTTGPSLFDPNVTAISYLKTVSYKEYRHNYKEKPEGVDDQDFDPNEIDEDSDNKNHTIRCRFLTIVAAEGEAEIRIYNKYFNTGDPEDPYASVTFERKNLTP